MPVITLDNVSLEFPLFGASALSLKKQLLRLTTGGLIKKSRDHKVATVRALHQINLTLQQGDRVGLIGHNGAGKSTLLRLFSRIYEPTQGNIYIQGEVSALLDVMLGMHPDATGYENIYLRGILQGLTRRGIKAKAQSIAEFTELGDYLAVPVRMYSNGMALRLAFAIATTLSPEILVLDEVVGVGDAAFIKKAEQRFEELMLQAKIVILASHDLSIIRKNCNKVIWLEAGELQFFGSCEEGIERYEKNNN
ncbi:MAG: sugar ABC transporter ATP-binding protein [Gammaproteobacteria bacterium RIFCSPHIGHO2_12_FULL_42_13]|nr:MAG: sugar ABC transporter ATP-binding protein [Gammaproteobacteria bacterium RIFCSPHIGHO2_12_FULL_42_13]